MANEPQILQSVNGKWLYAVDAMVLGHQGSEPAPMEGRLGLLCDDLKKIAGRGDSTLIAQFYELVLPGTILARHIFRGLKRPLRTDGNSGADERMLIYTRKPSFDAVWDGSGTHGRVKRIDAPTGKVFTVIVNPNEKHKDQFPAVSGWVNHWGWVEEDQGLSEASKDWVDRYSTKIWTREGVST